MPYVMCYFCHYYLAQQLRPTKSCFIFPELSFSVYSALCACFQTTSTGSEVTSSSSSSSSSVGDVTAARLPAGGSGEPVSCDVYCSACAVSFNSTTQARQHYHGKTHAKRLRITHNDQHQPRPSHPIPRTFQSVQTAIIS